MKIINIGILGCASIAERSVIPAILNLKEYFRLVAVGSRTFEKSYKFAKKFGCEAVDSYDKLIKNPDIDALYIPLPTGLHDEWVNKSIEVGKNVYAEKSMALNYSQVKKMVHNARKYNVALMEGFMFQYHNQHKHLKKLLNEGIIGNIRHFSSSFGFPPLDSGNFRYDEKLSGGALMDAAGYPLRSAFFIIGDELKVSAASLFRDKSTGSSIYGSAYLCGKEGIGTSISFGFDNYYQCNYTIWGSKGKITVEKAFTPKPDQIPTFKLETKEGEKIINSKKDNHFEKAFIEFHNIITNNEKREKHYKEILQQGEALEKINTLTQ